MTDAEFVERSYALILRRAPDAAGLEGAVRALADGAVSRAGFVQGLAESAEFAELRGLDDALLAARGGPLRGLGAPPGTDERRIEIPWVISRYRGEAHVLDVGYAYAPPAYIDVLTRLGAADLVGVDLAEPVEIPGLRPVQADLRDLPFAVEDAAERALGPVAAVPATADVATADTDDPGHEILDDASRVAGEIQPLDVTHRLIGPHASHF